LSALLATPVNRERREKRKKRGKKRKKILLVCALANCTDHVGAQQRASLAILHRLPIPTAHPKDRGL